jgi:hypothetical protein
MRGVHPSEKSAVTRFQFAGVTVARIGEGFEKVLRPQMSFLGIRPAIYGARFSFMAEDIDVVSVPSSHRSCRLERPRNSGLPGAAFPDARCMFGREEFVHWTSGRARWS